MLSQSLTNFMLELSKDPVKLEAFRKNPESVLASAELSLEEKEIIKSENQDKIQQAIDPNLICRVVGAVV